MGQGCDRCPNGRGIKVDSPGSVEMGFRSSFAWRRIPCSARDTTYSGARLAISKVLAQHGYTADVPMPDISTKEKAQEYIGLDMEKERKAKDKFLKTIVPEWLEKARANGRLAKL